MFPVSRLTFISLFIPLSAEFFKHVTHTHTQVSQVPENMSFLEKFAQL